MSRSHLVGVLMMFFSIDASARMCSPIRTEQNEGLQYVINLVQSFGWAKEAINTYTDHSIAPEATHQDVVNSMTAYMLELKQANESYECSATLVEPYKTSEIQGVGLSATGSAFTYRRLIALNMQLTGIIKGLLNDGLIRQGDFADKITDVTIQRDKAWEQLLHAATASTFAMVVFPKGNETLSTLNMTLAQRNALNRSLEEIFGAGLRADMPNVKSSFAGCGWLIYRHINKPEWKFLDTQ